MLSGATHGEFVQVGLTQNRHLVGANVGYQGGVVGRHPAFQDLGGGSGHLAASAAQVFNGYGHTG